MNIFMICWNKCEMTHTHMHERQAMYIVYCFIFWVCCLYVNYCFRSQDNEIKFCIIEYYNGVWFDTNSITIKILLLLLFVFELKIKYIQYFQFCSILLWFCSLRTYSWKIYACIVVRIFLFYLLILCFKTDLSLIT